MSLLIQSFRFYLFSTLVIVLFVSSSLSAKIVGHNPFGMQLRPVPHSVDEINTPVIVLDGPTNECSLITRRDGTLEMYFITMPGRDSVSLIRSMDGGLTWSAPEVVFDLPGRAYYAVQALEDNNGNLQVVFHIHKEGEGGYRGNLYEVYHTRLLKGEEEWSQSQRIIPGYVGAIRGFIELDSGRLLLSVGLAVPEREQKPDSGPDFGWNDVVTLWSDDSGNSWHWSPDRLNFPLEVEFITRYGAIEPVLLELQDGRVWMLIRDRGGVLMQSFSEDAGESWSSPEPTNFISSDSPATILRLSDGRIVLITNACQNWSNPNSYARGGREVLHIAISSDDGRSWQGFRHVLHETVGIYQGDRGTSYASITETADGLLAIFAGQGPERRFIMLLHPDWISATHQLDQLDLGPEYWTQYGSSGIAVLYDEQTDVPAVSIPVTKREPSGASWNFPSAHSGTLHFELWIAKGVDNLQIGLTDHFSRVDDAMAGANGIFYLHETADALLTREQWLAIRMEWDSAGLNIFVDGEHFHHQNSLRASAHGVNYLRLGAAPESSNASELLIRNLRMSTRPSILSGSNGPLVWLDSLGKDNFLMDYGGKVERWQDRSGRGNHFVQAEPNRRPTFSENALKGHPAVEFSGSQWLSIESLPEVRDLQAFTLFVVYATAEEHPLRFMGVVGNGGYRADIPGMMVGFNDTNIVTQNNAAAFMISNREGDLLELGASAKARRLPVNLAVAPQYPTLKTVSFQSSTSDSPIGIWLFGKDKSEGGPILQQPFALESLEGLSVGAASSFGGKPFAGAIAAFLLFDRELDPDEREQVESMLSARYQLSPPSRFIIDPRAEQIALSRAHAIGSGGRLLALRDDTLFESRDGAPWQQKFAIERAPSLSHIGHGNGLLVETRKGTLIHIIRDRTPENWTRLEYIDGAFNNDEAKSHIFAVRSLDGGRTWQDAVKIQTEYCGAMRDIMVTRDNHIIVSIQAWDTQHERHITSLHVSTDDGLTYKQILLDNGIGRGLHDGFYESTVTELNDGRIWLVARTSLGFLWESFSADGGFNWSEPEPTPIESGGYPAFVLRLESGRIIIAWNRPYPVGFEGRKDLINIAPASWFWGLQATSRFNREMSIMFSEDDGATWGEPILIAAGRQDFASLRYPHIFEPNPGDIFMWAGPLGIRFNESDFFPTLEE